MRALTIIIITMGWMFNASVSAKTLEYGATACKEPGYHCVKIKRKDSWGTLFPDLDQRKLIVYANRYNGFLRKGLVLAVPDELAKKSLADISPLPQTIETNNERFILVDQKKMAWGAYNKFGKLLRWGPVSAGSEHCIESENGCGTPAGTYRIRAKRGQHCISKSLPVKISGQQGGGYMPYCMFFHKGYALHGSNDLPGYNASHGCVRMLNEDAQWLNKIFTNIPGKNSKGTKVVIKSV